MPNINFAVSMWARILVRIKSDARHSWHSFRMKIAHSILCDEIGVISLLHSVIGHSEEMISLLHSDLTKKWNVV